MKERGVLFYRKWMSFFDTMTDAKCGKLVKALLHLGFDGEWKDLNDKDLDCAYSLIGNEILLDGDKYTKKCEMNRNAAKARYKKLKELGGVE